MIRAYHGSAAIFDKFDQGKARVYNDFYGGGVAYFTSNRDIAKSYARAMSRAKRVELKVVYDCTLNLRKTFDVDDTFAGDQLKSLIRGIDSETFARGAGLLKLGADKYDVISSLESGRMMLTGEQVFRGLSDGMVNTAKARNKLKTQRYDSLRYNGGLNMRDVTSVQHDVWLVYDSNLISIDAINMLVPKPSDERFMNSPVRVNVTYEAA